MFRILGSPKQLCHGLSRRDFLQIGGLGAAGLGLDTILARQSAASETTTTGLRGFGQAKNCIVLFLYGSPSQLETFDMKPEAPLEVRGEMQPIRSNVPGLDVCEHLPLTAKVMDRCTVARSMTHPYPIHGVAYAMTGVDPIDVGMELNPYDPRHHPWFGSVVQYLDKHNGRGGKDGSLNNVALPFPFSSQRTDQPFRAGPYGAFLGQAYNPVWTEFVGEGTVEITKQRPGFSYSGPEPYLGCTPDSHFRISATGRPEEITLDRLHRRRNLLEQFDEARRNFDSSTATKTLSRHQETAFSLLTSPDVANALDVRHEATATRELYGHTLFGQGCLAARRLIEAGTRVATVFWDEYGLAGDAWDTHDNHYPRMKEQLMPPFDRAFSGLITDLDRRGMLDDTLVVCVSEHGRTPKLNSKASRDHWSRAYSSVLAGGGIAGGNVVGATDEQAGDVTDRPISPKDLLATMYHLLGIDPHSRIPDRSRRPVGILPDTSGVVEEMLA